MRPTVIRITAVSLTIAAWLIIGVSLHGGWGPHVETATHEASGRLMAEQALACLEPGGPITIITRDTTTFKNPASDIQLASFLKAINHVHATVGSIQRLQVDPLRPIAVPSTDFCEAIRNTPPGGVIVSFMGPPRLTDADRARIAGTQPAIVAFCSGNQPQSVNLESLFKAGLLQAVVADRRSSQQPSSESAAQPNRRGELFQTLTAANFSGTSVAQATAHK